MAARPAHERPLLHSAARLRYFLIEGRARLEPLRVFDSRRAAWAGRQVTFYALGTSHAVLVELEDSALTELLTCASGDIGARVIEQRAAGSDWSISGTIDSLRYDCRLSRFALDGNALLRGAFAPEDRLVCSYRVEGGAEEPVTHIGWRTDEHTLTVETLHTYPHEGRGVRSKSVFRVLPPARA